MRVKYYLLPLSILFLISTLVSCASSPKQTLRLGLAGHEICGMADLITKTKLHRDRATGYYANSFACVEAYKKITIDSVELRESYKTNSKRVAMVMVKVPKDHNFEEKPLLSLLNKYGKLINANIMVPNTEHSLNRGRLRVYDAYYQSP